MTTGNENALLQQGAFDTAIDDVDNSRESDFPEEILLEDSIVTTVPEGDQTVNTVDPWSGLINEISKPAPQEKKFSFKYGGGKFEISSKGIFYIGIDNEGNKKAPQFVCSPLRVIAKTRDTKSSEWGRLLEWKDADNVEHRWAMPIELLQGDSTDVRRELSRQGLSIATRRSERDLLGALIQEWPTNDRARCVEKLGWHGSIYVMPNHSIGQGNETVVFQNTHAIEPAFTSLGTVEQWINEVAALAKGNSKVMFAICVAFSGPLAEIAGEDSGGFHLRGGSSSGKSTALLVAASIWGNPSKYPRLWRSTTNGLEAIASLHNDGLLILDELSQCDPKEVGDAAYMLANGQGKARASRNATARPSATWRVIFLSAGEESLSSVMAKANKKANAGQEIRLADMSADAGQGMGLFEELHGIQSPARFAESIKQAAMKHHGAVGLEWLNHLVINRSEIAELLQSNIKQFVDHCVPPYSEGQVMRVARRFALIAAAGELATHYGLTGWQTGDAEAAVKKCFEAWLDLFGGNTNREERNILSSIRLFFEQHGSSRFDDSTANSEHRIINRAGFMNFENGVKKYYVLTEVFKQDICSGFDYNHVVRILKKHGWIDLDSAGKSTKPKQLPTSDKPTRVYVFNEKMWEDS